MSDKKITVFMPAHYCLICITSGKVIDWGEENDDFFLIMDESNFSSYGLMKWEPKKGNRRELIGSYFPIDGKRLDGVEFKGKKYDVYFSNYFAQNLGQIIHS